MNTPTTPYEKLGGAPALQQLTQRFYELMDELPEAWGIRQIHPENLAGSQQSLFEFLSGWLGGPQLFMEKRGHPRLRILQRARPMDAVHAHGAGRAGQRQRLSRGPGDGL